jgi:predicted acylesterase/phospholipase RssA
MAIFDVVFEGGGAKGSAFVGALQVLKQQGHAIRRLVGTSAGAITATLVAAGYTPEELLQAVNEKQPNGKPRFAAFMDRPARANFSQAEKDNSETMRALQEIHLPLGRDAVINLLLDSGIYAQLFSFVECGGFFGGFDFRTWLAEKLALKGISAEDTLSSAFQKTNVDLSVVASDTRDVEMLVLNHRTAPDCPVAWAVRMSMSIPFVWQEVVWQKEWGLYCGRDKTGTTIVDGGVLSNFPIRLIDERVPEIMGDTDPAGALNLGLLLDETLSSTSASGSAAAPLPSDHIHTVQRVSRLMDTMMGAPDNAEMRKHEDEICRLPVKGYGTTEFNMSDQRLAALVDGGRQAMVAHLAKRQDLGSAQAAVVAATP